jgi:hypothetical protein
MDNRFQCGCELGDDCTKTTMCHVQTAIEDEQEEIERLTAEIGRARSALHESYRTFGYSHEQSALMVSQDLSAGEERDA